MAALGVWQRVQCVPVKKTVKNASLKEDKLISSALATSRRLDRRGRMAVIIKGQDGIRKEIKDVFLQAVAINY